MTVADGALPATRQPDKEPSAAGAGSWGSGMRPPQAGTPLHPSSAPQPQDQVLICRGGTTATAKSFWRKSPECSTSWPELQRSPPSAQGHGSPSSPPSPGRARGQQRAALAPALTCCGVCRAGESGCGRAIAGDAPACPTFLLNIARQVLPSHPPQPAWEMLGTHLSPAWSSSPRPGMLSPQLPVPKMPLSPSHSPASPLPSLPARASAERGPVAPRGGSQVDGWTHPLQLPRHGEPTPK